MKSRTKILVPVDFSPTAERAFRFALRIGTLLTAEIHLLHAIYPQMENLDQPLQPSASATLTRSHLVEEKLQLLIEAERERWKNGGWPEIFTHVEIGNAISVIKARIKAQAYDLIVIGTRARHEAMENMLGTVASDVVGNTSCPVIVIPEQTGDLPISRIAHAIEPRWVQEDMVSAVINRFRPLHAEVHLVRFSDLPADEPPRQLLALKTALGDQFPQLPVKTHRLSKQDLIRDMNQFIEREKIDLLIMYRSASGILGRLFHRSRTRLMARHTRIPLLVI
ncbi:universal stress protein [Flavilitoribacter nigricans]|uniref:UspA domain-containing protein n=1 Tax=Flavilitoribacter nigricans (strain ATCC 23147 / DSM 23189 / NBRC 102662 / NCIMB 1420 / SS-2) TaxID=1122177 RepID=A0A2D0MYJ2_FLAN2|nr:universal stress protein [Flavilitoribacter nigricans]PHN00949.1 hypothetical protein CRP01_39605 [Flavilitoribacter nigricans DSM 23189 = NBRC 102662]